MRSLLGQIRADVDRARAAPFFQQAGLLWPVLGKVFTLLGELVNEVEKLKGKSCVKDR